MRAFHASYTNTQIYAFTMDFLFLDSHKQFLLFSVGFGCLSVYLFLCFSVSSLRIPYRMHSSGNCSGINFWTTCVCMTGSADSQNLFWMISISYQMERKRKWPNIRNSINKTAEIFITLSNEIYFDSLIYFFVLLYSISSHEQVVDISNGQYFLMACACVSVSVYIYFRLCFFFLLHVLLLRRRIE